MLYCYNSCIKLKSIYYHLMSDFSVNRTSCPVDVKKIHVFASAFILVINQLDAQNLFYNKFISCLYMFRTPCARRQEVKIVLYSLWYHHSYRWLSRAKAERGLDRMAFHPVLSQPVHGTATYRCDDTRGCIVQFWPPDDEHLCSKHVEA